MLPWPCRQWEGDSIYETELTLRLELALDLVLGWGLLGRRLRYYDRIYYAIGSDDSLHEDSG